MQPDTHQESLPFIIVKMPGVIRLLQPVKEMLCNLDHMPCMAAGVGGTLIDCSRERLYKGIQQQGYLDRVMYIGKAGGGL